MAAEFKFALRSGRVRNLDIRGLFPSFLANAHDGIDEVALTFLERLDSLAARASDLLDDKVDVLGVNARFVDRFTVVLFLFFLLLGLGTLVQTELRHSGIISRGRSGFSRASLARSCWAA